MKLIKQLFILSLFTALTSVGKTQTYIPYDSCFNMNGTACRSLSIVNDTLLIGAEGMDTAGGIAVHHIAQWDGQHFHAMGIGTEDNGVVQDAVYYNDTVFVVGGFTNMGGYLQYIAPWYNGHWTQPIMDTSPSLADIYSVKEWHDTLFFGNGGITINGTNYCCLFARSPNGQFFQVNGLNEKVWDMAIYNGKLYTVAWYYLQEYNPATNHCDIIGDFNNYPEAMVVDTINNFLYIAGGFNGAYIGNTVVYTDNVVRWNGFYPENIGTGINGINEVYAVELYRGDLYIGGAGIDTLSNTYVGKSLARWDGQQWHYVGPYPGVKGMTIRAIKVYKDTLYTGGTYAPGYSYPMVGNDTVNGLIRLYMPPDTTCKYLMPRVFTENNEDTFYLSSGSVDVQFYNNNAYVQTWDWNFDDGGTDTIKDPLHTFTDTGSYNICVTVNDTGCIKTACKTITVLNPTTISTIDIKYEEFKLYPNPTNGNFFVDINLSEIKEYSEIRIFNPQGILKTKYQIQKGQNHIEIPSSQWTAGNYLVCLIIGDKLIDSKKLILTK